PFGQLIIGGTILFVGFLWTLDAMDILDTEEIIQYWPLGLVLLGALKLFGIGMRRSLVGGLFLTIIGVLIIGNETGALYLSMRLFWPIVIMALGAVLVARSFGWMGGRIGAVGPGEGSTAVMGGVLHREPAQLFQGGSLTAIMGGVDYDLSQATGIEPDAAVDVFAFWGGIDMAVPPNWRIDMRVTALLGGITDSRSPSPAGLTGPTLVVRGIVMMGGLDIKDRVDR
ncbi:MAG TPA: LiaF domain-containing protein, partial [Candidatus Eisenbacteria bacterium]